MLLNTHDPHQDENETTKEYNIITVPIYISCNYCKPLRQLAQFFETRARFVKTSTVNTDSQLNNIAFSIVPISFYLPTKFKHNLFGSLLIRQKTERYLFSLFLTDKKRKKKTTTSHADDGWRVKNFRTLFNFFPREWRPFWKSLAPSG